MIQSRQEMRMAGRTPSSVSPLYLLERSDVGIVQLDARRHVVGMNDFARRVLPVDEKQPFDRFVLSFHPERSQPKVEFMLDQAGQCPVAAPPPMTMIINIPERVLLIKVSRMSGSRGDTTGYTLVFYDITELVAGDEAPAAADSARPGVAAGHRRLLKVPTVSGQHIVLVDAADISCIRSEGHYTRVCTPAGNRFCNLAISDLESRLDPEQFMRVHRSHIVNLAAVTQVLRGEGRVALELAGGGSEAIPVSRSSAPEVLRRLGVAAGSAQATRATQG
jgi:hypothetical protein